MRIFIALLVFSFLCLSTQRALSLPVQNPSSPTQFEQGIFINECAPLFFSRFPQFLDFEFGFYGDYVFDRKLQTVNGDTIHNTKIFTNAGYLAVTMCDWLEAFTTLGVTNIKINADQRALVGNNSLFSNAIEIDSGSNFSWSAGGILKLLESRGWTIGIEGQYFWAHPHVKFTQQNAVFANSYFYLDDAKFRYWEAQIGGGISYRIDFASCSALIPYVGVKWSRSRLDNANVVITDTNSSTTSPLLLLIEDKKWGYAVGVTLLAYGCGSVTGEVRFLDEKAVNVTMKLQF